MCGGHGAGSAALAGRLRGLLSIRPPFAAAASEGAPAFCTRRLFAFVSGGPVPGTLPCSSHVTCAPPAQLRPERNQGSQVEGSAPLQMPDARAGCPLRSRLAADQTRVPTPFSHLRLEPLRGLGLRDRKGEAGARAGAGLCMVTHPEAPRAQPSGVSCGVHLWPWVTDSASSWAPLGTGGSSKPPHPRRLVPLATSPALGCFPEA